jgi:hypothetical protein
MAEEGNFEESDLIELHPSPEELEFICSREEEQELKKAVVVTITNL